MRKRNEALQALALACSYCHHDKMRMRHIHWLKLFGKISKATGQELLPHLEQQYPRNGQPWCYSIMSWCHTMRSLWGSFLDDEGRPLPVWVAWSRAQSR